MRRSRTMVFMVLAALAIAAAAVTTVQAASGPIAHAAATCSDYPNQKAAQEAADTRDSDGDGVFCVIYSG
jgi:predicted metal-binding membrane protein